MSLGGRLFPILPSLDTVPQNSTSAVGVRARQSSESHGEVGMRSKLHSPREQTQRSKLAVVASAMRDSRPRARLDRFYTRTGISSVLAILKVQKESAFEGTPDLSPAKSGNGDSFRSSKEDSAAPAAVVGTAGAVPGKGRACFSSRRSKLGIQTGSPPRLRMRGCEILLRCGISRPQGLAFSFFQSTQDTCQVRSVACL